MNADNSSLLNHAQSVIGATLAQSNAAIGSINPPAWHSIENVNPNAFTSVTIAAATIGPMQGNQSNPCGKQENAEPVGFVTPENNILKWANNLRVAGNQNLGTLWL